MSVLILLISVSLIVSTGFLCAFIWALKKDQYQDDYTPSVRMLFEDDEKSEQNSKTNQE